ncbi:D-alanyl-D-alanine dipeptidase [Rhodospirillum rubrum]|uniref:D-alanyl-D-alanine dipeptidase n=1 Tax=Rhodospirillum rubrum TaxID=1085 RepID=UPI001905C636|nr:D-alanyl-D-alanine dipeptidase [Rhodospirillum rubrum]MBK1664658.1 D-alanyl-D-alanine dipeptidase [Rhodospirillum rubrum]MBK1677755.1 D-alanyl-D-alanine dipeptidase [Rhodospirillum rubrum]
MLTEITAEAFGVEVDIVYATDRNFTGKPVYGRGACYLNPEAADLLARAVDLADRLGYRLRILDAFRPAEAQWVLWRSVPDATFIADPNRGSPHSMGAAVDLTLVDKASGAVLDMGTGFDDMRPLSFHGETGISLEAQRNRIVLLGLMTAAGWDYYRNEWWHYQLFNARARYPVLSDSAAGTRMMGDGGGR